MRGENETDLSTGNSTPAANPTDSATSAQPKRDAFSSSQRAGCRHIGLWILIACLLLPINTAIFTSFYQWASEKGPRFMRFERVTQASLFAGPVLMFVLQYWIKDWIFPRRGRATSASDSASSA